MVMPDPFLFISHKHSDVAIAKCLAEFIRESSVGNVTVHLSSDPNYAGPRIGRNLNAELKGALGNAEVVLLIYTAEDQDWSYCMWECGVATDPKSPHTNIYVLQCGDDAPKVFTDQLRVNVRHEDELLRFTQAFLTDSDFFPGREHAISRFNADGPEIKSANKKLYDRLQAVLPPLNPQRPEEWPAWPYLRIEIPQEQIMALDENANREQVQAAVTAHAVIVNSARAEDLFGLSFSERQRVEQLLTAWRSAYPDKSIDWYDSMCSQIFKGSQRRFPAIQKGALRQVGKETLFIPVLSRTQLLPATGQMRFDVYFCSFTDPGLMARDRMIPKSETLWKRFPEDGGKTMTLVDLLNDLEANNRNRVPFFGEFGQPVYIVHRSMIDQFLMRLVRTGKSEEIKKASLADLLAESHMKQMFEATFAVVGHNATLEEARQAMNSITECRDVFVTQNGTRGEPVLGWLTNVMFTQQV